MSLSVLWAPRRGRCDIDSEEEWDSGGTFLVRSAPLGQGPFSFQPSLRLPRVGPFQLCAYLEDDFLDVLASARATIDGTPPPACPAGTPHAVRFAGLSKRIVAGRQERFGFRSIGSRSRVQGAIEVRIVARNGRGKTISKRSTRRRGGSLIPIRLRYRRPPVRVVATYLQRLADEALCRQSMGRRVRGQDRVYARFSAVRQYRPRILYYGASGRIIDLRWRGWNKPKARARGVLPFNDCVPYCAVGTITPYPVRLTVSRVRRCGNHYLYTRMTWRYLGRKPPQVGWSLTHTVRCGW